MTTHIAVSLIGLHVTIHAARLLEVRRKYKSRMVYKWGATDRSERWYCGVQGHRLPISGVGWWDTTLRLSTACSQTEVVDT
jgi:hypothetical protein